MVLSSFNGLLPYEKSYFYRLFGIYRHSRHILVLNLVPIKFPLLDLLLDRIYHLQTLIPNFFF